ncbi:uncharacterized protein LOC135287318 [Passer domesticus]|uniref:uncharacterized protein LOC135287318 n=1 Tax=Passer domesticus TaxID=48849 RepID=UPI0030FE4742
MWSLTESLVELLQDTDGEIVCMTVMLLSFIILDNDTLIAGPITLQLVEALLPLFDHDNNQVQLLSILLFRTLVTLPRKKEKKALKTPLRQSLLSLFFHCHDENRLVAQVSQETLLCVAELLKRRDLEKQLKNKKLWKFTECLLAEDTSRAAEHLRRALPYLRNPQESLRAAAIRFTGEPRARTPSPARRSSAPAPPAAPAAPSGPGAPEPRLGSALLPASGSRALGRQRMAGRHLRGKREELQLICSALEHLTEDISSAVSDAARQTLDVLRALQSEGYSVFQRLQDQLRRAWRTRPRLSGLGCLRCWSSAES